MVWCSVCNDWFHFACLGLTEDEASVTAVGEADFVCSRHPKQEEGAGAKQEEVEEGGVESSEDDCDDGGVDCTPSTKGPIPLGMPAFECKECQAVCCDSCFKQTSSDRGVCVNCCVGTNNKQSESPHTRFEREANSLSL